MSWTFLRDEIRKARKRYRCCGCWEFIEIGESHLARSGIDDAYGPLTARWHPECERYAFDDIDGIYESPPGCFSRKEALEYEETSKS